MRVTVFDASAALALLLEQKGAEMIEDMLEKASDSDNPILISAVNWAEVLSVVGRKQGAAGLQELRRFQNAMPIEVRSIDEEHAETAATLKNSVGLGLADAFAAALAKAEDADLVTGDREFKAVQDQLRIVWLG